MTGTTKALAIAVIIDATLEQWDDVIKLSRQFLDAFRKAGNTPWLCGEMKIPYAL